MPRWVKIILVLLSAGLAVWALMSPRLIIGQVITRPKVDQVVPMRGLDMQTEVFGHVHKFRVNEDGYWAIPLASAYPFDKLHVRISLEEGKPLHEVAVDVSDMWIRNLVTIEVVYEEQEPSLRVVRSDIKEQISLIAANFFNKAMAGELLLPEQLGGVAANEASDMSTMEYRNVESQIDAIIQSHSEYLKGSELSVSSEREAFQGLSYLGKILTINAVESHFSVPIPDEHWREFDTSADITDYVVKRQMLQKVVPASGSARNLSDWSKALEDLPKGQQPVFQSTR
jgi:acyl carrier protein